MKRILTGLVLASLLVTGLTACTGSPASSPADSSSVRSAPISAEDDPLGRLVQGVLAGRTWAWTKPGQEAPTDAISMYRGADHCDWQSVIFLNVGWPLGSPDRSLESRKARDSVRQFVRDPAGRLDDSTTGAFASPAELPVDATNTGYLNSGVHLWLANSDPNGAYLTGGGTVERWARTDFHIMCA